MKLVSLMVSLWLVAWVAVAKEDADSLFTAGRTLEQEGKLELAIANYALAVEERADFMEAQRRWALCLQGLAVREKDAKKRRELITAAGDRFSLAVKCTGADGRVHLQRAFFLNQFATETARDITQRLEITAQAAEEYRLGLADVMDVTERATAQAQLGVLFVQWGHEVTDTDQERTLFEQSLPLFEQASAVLPVEAVAKFRDNWAVALLQVGRLTNDRTKLLAAAEQLHYSAVADPENPIKRYNLACAWASASENARALEELGEAVKDDHGGQVLNAVMKDPEWAPLRETAEFRQLIQKHNPEAFQLFQNGVMLQHSGEHASTAELVTNYFVRAVAEYDRAVAIRPDFLEAQFNAAMCLSRITKFVHDREESLRWAGLAQQRYTAASGCADADWQVYFEWGRFLLNGVAPQFVASDEKRTVLQQARALFEKGLSLVGGGSNRGQIQSELGGCLVQLSHVTDDSRERLRLNEQASKNLEEATKIESLSNNSQLYGWWGLAQLDIARLQKNRLQTFKAMERLQMALEKDPLNVEVYYYLGCAHAMLGQRVDAVRYLKQCLALDKINKFALLAATDPDWDGLRNDRDFLDLLETRLRSAPVVNSATPRLGN